MTLLSLYHTHAELCLQMAASSKSLETRERWLELANHWRQKANDSEGLTVSAAQPFSQPLPVVVAPKIFGKPLSNAVEAEPPASRDVMMAPNTPAPSLSPSSDEVSNTQQLQIEAGSDVTPSLIPWLHEVSNPQVQIEAGNDVTPLLSPSLHGVSNPQPQIDAGDDVLPIELDDDWKQLLADIRGR
jgi:hypothetical protein